MQLDQNNPTAQEQMIAQQIRTWGVSDERVLDSLRAIHREQFVPEQFQSVAFADWRIPLGHNEYMMTPKVEARMLQALALQHGDTVLEIGTGSGFVTACLASLTKHVSSIDIHPDFVTRAKRCLQQAGYENTTLEQGSVLSYEPEQTFDVMVVTGSVPDFTDTLKSHWLQWLNSDGRLFVVVGQPPVMQAKLFSNVDDGKAAEEILFETNLKPLTGCEINSEFVF